VLKKFFHVYQWKTKQIQFQITYVQIQFQITYVQIQFQITYVPQHFSAYYVPSVTEVSLGPLETFLWMNHVLKHHLR